MPLTIRDTSRDSPNPFLPSGTDNLPGAIPHSVTFRMETEKTYTGWSAFPPPSFSMYSGQSRNVFMDLVVTPQANDPIYRANLTVTMRSSSDEVSRSYPVVAITPGLQSFSAQVPRGLMLAPGEIGSLEVVLTNQGVFPRSYGVELSSDCPFAFGRTPEVLVAARQSTSVFIDVLAPEQKIRYASESCSVLVTVRPADNPGQLVTTATAVQVDGFYFNPLWAFWTIAAILVFLILFLLFKRRKEAIEEEILGKPQKPWTIPAEVVYLDALKQRDARAWYVVRHYLMEDEYRSALLWYKHEKKGTRGRRSKERLVVGIERKLDRRQAAWDHRMERADRQADRFEASLQRRLDRQSAARHRKQQRKHRKVVARMQAAHDKRSTRILEKWEAQVRRAEKKGQPIPPKPDVGGPDLPDEPVLEEIQLADHRWATRADRFRSSMGRLQERLEVRAEGDMAKATRKAQRNIQRLARKIDDPGFAAQHPLMTDSA